MSKYIHKTKAGRTVVYHDPYIVFVSVKARKHLECVRCRGTIYQGELYTKTKWRDGKTSCFCGNCSYYNVDDKFIAPEDWDETVLYIMRFYGEQCFICYSTDDLGIYHKIPIYMKGYNDLQNLVVMCAECNEKRLMIRHDQNERYKYIMESWVKKDVRK